MADRENHAYLWTVTIERSHEQVDHQGRVIVTRAAGTWQNPPLEQDVTCVLVVVVINDTMDLVE